MSGEASEHSVCVLFYADYHKHDAADIVIREAGRAQPIEVWLEYPAHPLGGLFSCQNGLGGISWRHGAHVPPQERG